ncbi:integrase core domain-containing protein, partial [Actinomycetospora sp. SF1]
WSGLREVERETAEWVRWYNYERLHSSVGYLPPVEWEAHYTAAVTRQAAAA